MRYNLITLNASEMMGRYETVKPENSNWKIEYKYVVGTVADSQYSEKAFLDQRVVSSVDAYEDCAMFHQLRRCIEKQRKDSGKPALEWNEDSLRRSIIYVDFKDVFMGSSKIEKGDNSYINLTEKELKCSVAPDHVRLRWMLNPENGITLQFPNGADGIKEINFVPFDKSSSMARDCRMTFVDRALKEEMDTRLQLGIKFENISLSQSKYYAYRGLYLTTAHRIERSDSFKLTAETVIVMDDDEHDIMLNNEKIPIRVFVENTEKAEEKSAQEDKQGDENGKEEKILTFCEKEIKKYENVNAFDGEGIISPIYAEIINEQLKNNYGSKKDAASFQIRMPFAKGMLHQVDFHAFFADTIASKHEECTDKDAPLMVRDAFKKERDLRNAHIIMTKSMFKCFRWLNSHWNALSDEERKSFSHDPMRYYFEMVEKYDHSLYVGNTDAVLLNNGSTKLNYQYISTLKMNASELRKLAKKQIDITMNKENRFIRVQSQPDSEDNVQQNSKDESVADKWKEALKKNPALHGDRYISKELGIMKEEDILDIGIGRIPVAGECRFLSGDLLAFLCFVSKKLSDKKYRECFENVKNEVLYRNKFYAAKDTIDYLDEKRFIKYFGLLRNPHLSRNEQCVLKPYSSELYEKYFSHLKGVIMVSRKSLVPMILAGADFDGDLVKVIAENTVVTAILKGAYKRINGKYIRKLAVVRIPSLTPNETKGTKSIPYEVVFDTFASQVGYISNMAFKVSRMEYGDVDEEQKKDFINKCAECTIITGLEIDAAKTGFHPVGNIKETEKLLRRNGMHGNDYFIELKKKMEGVTKLGAGMRTFRVSPFSEKSDHSRYYLKGSNNPYMSIKRIAANDTDAARVDILPELFAEAANELAAKRKEEAESKRKGIATVPDSVFVFGGEDGWRDKLEEMPMNKTVGLIKAYYKILDIGTKLYRVRELYKNTKLLGCIVNILTKQYGGVRTVIITDSEEGKCVTAETALSNAYDYLEGRITDEKAGVRALKKLIRNEWQYTAREERLQKLQEILSAAENKKGREALTEEIPAEVAKLLTNFSHGGYRIVYYMIKDVICRYKERDGADAIIEAQKSRIDRKSEKSSDSGEQSYEAYRNIYTGELYKDFMVSARAKESKRIWNKKIVKLCRDKLAEMFGKDMNEALKYVFAARETADKDALFFWNVFDAKTILDNIVEETSQKAEEPAEKGGKEEGEEIAQ